MRYGRTAVVLLLLYRKVHRKIPLFYQRMYGYL